MEHAFLITLLYILTLFSFVLFILLLLLVILFPLYILLLVLLPILRLSVITSLFLRIRVELLCTIIIAIIIVFFFISYCVRTAMTYILATKYIQQWKIPIQNNKTLETVEFITNFLDGAVAITVEGSILRTCLEWVASDPKL